MRARVQSRKLAFGLCRATHALDERQMQKEAPRLTTKGLCVLTIKNETSLEFGREGEFVEHFPRPFHVADEGEEQEEGGDHEREGGLDEDDGDEEEDAHEGRPQAGAPLRLDDEACALDFLFHGCYALKQIDVNLASVTEYPVR